MLQYTRQNTTTDMLQYARQNTATDMLQYTRQILPQICYSTPDKYCHRYNTVRQTNTAIDMLQYARQNTATVTVRLREKLAQFNKVSTSLWTTLPTDHFHITVDHSTNRPSPHHCGPLYQQTISTSLWTTLTTEVSTLLWTTLPTSHLHITVENYQQRVVVVTLFV